MKKTEAKDLNYYKNNCEEDYIKTPISVLRYISELEKAINYTRCSEQLFGTSKIEIDCVTENKEYKIIFENEDTYVFINDFGQADEMYKKHFKDVKTK